MILGYLFDDGTEPQVGDVLHCIGNNSFYSRFEITEVTKGSVRVADQKLNNIDRGLYPIKGFWSKQYYRLEQKQPAPEIEWV